MSEEFITYLEENYSVERVTFSNELRLSGECPFCNKERYPLSLYVNVESGLGECKHCGVGFKPVKFVMAAEACDYRRALAILSGDEEEYKREVKEEEKVVEETPHDVLWPKMVSIDEHERAYRYLSDRCISDKAMKHFSIHAAVSNIELDKERKLYVKNRIIIPCFGADLKAQGWQARDIFGKSKSKYYNLPGWDKSQSLLNVHAIPQTPNYIIVVEGFMDLCGWWQAGYTNVVATFGKTLSATQAEMLRALEPKILYCAWDGEAHYQKHTLAEEHGHRFADIRIVPMGKQDADEMTASELGDALSAAKPSTKQDKLLDMLRAL